MAPGATKHEAVGVIRRLRAAGHEALLAGGCVRDVLLGQRPVDYDVATGATPQEVKRLFKRVLMVGARFGVAMVIRGRRVVEVTTFRADLSYSDGRRPDGVAFVTAAEDAARRDFTINGMFYDPIADEVVDYVGGREDLAAGVIRAIGDPEVRFAEDYLRMLRAVRFAARLGFRIDPATAAAVARRADRVARISGERIRDELEKMFADPSAAGAVDLMARLGLLQAILPELFTDEGRWPAARRRVQAVGPQRDVLGTFAALLAGLTAAEIGKIIRRWGAANDTRDSILWMAKHLHEWSQMPLASLAQLKRLLARRDWDRLRMLWRVEERAATGKQTCCRAVSRRVAGISTDRIAPRPLVTGKDLKRIGLENGPDMGEILSAVYEAQLNEELPDRRSGLRLARKLVKDLPKRPGAGHD